MGGYERNECSCLNCNAVKDLAALNIYGQEHPWVEDNGRNDWERSIFEKENLVFPTKGKGVKI